jgi:hypothetical protein
MKKSVSAFVFISFVTLSSSFSFAADSSDTKASTEAQPPCAVCAANKSNDVNIPALGEVLDKAKTSNAHFIDGYFFADTKLSGNELNVTFKNPTDLNLSTANITSSDNVSQQFFSQKSLMVALAYLTKATAGFSLNQKLLVLSELGNKLSAGYSSTVTENKNMNSVYMNAVNGLRQGGICGDIHKLLGEAAQAMGFTDIGRQSGTWQQDLSKDEAEGHAILHFKDPKTGTYYIQNYSQIYDTKEKTLQGATDVASKMIGVLPGVSYVESAPGKIHSYVPATAQWVKDQIGKAGNFNPDSSALTVKIGTNEQTVAAQVGSDHIKGFMMGSQVNTKDGVYRVEAVGISTKGEVKKELQSKIIDEVGASVQAYGGGLKVTAPAYDSTKEQFSTGDRSALFYNVDAKGTARINSVTGKIEFTSSVYDWGKGPNQQYGTGTQGIQNQLKVGVEKDWKELNLKAHAERTWEWIPVEIAKKNVLKPSTTYDNVGVIYDTTNPNKKQAYLVVGADVYFLEGVDKSSAIALKNSIKAVMPTEKFGSFSVSADLAKVVSNKSGDPFYNILPTTSVSIDWNKVLNSFADVGANVSATKGTQITPFGVIGPINPEMGSSDSKIRGVMYLHTKF